MALKRDGWQLQAAHLALAHAAVGRAAVVAAKQARPRPLKAATIHSHAVGTEPAGDPNTGKSDLVHECEPQPDALSELERQLERKAAELKFQNEYIKVLNAQIASAKARNRELEAELAPTRETLAGHDNESRSQQISLDLAGAENQRLSGRLTEMNAIADEARIHLERCRSALVTTEEERNRLAAALVEAREKHRSETDAFNSRLLAATSRAGDAEQALERAQQLIVARAAETRATKNKLAEITLAKDAVAKKLELAQNSLQMKDRQVEQLSKSRSSLIAGTHQLSEALKTKTGALAQAEEKFGFLAGRAKAMHAKLVSDQDTIKQLNARLYNDRNERKVLEAALRKALTACAELQHKCDYAKDVEAVEHQKTIKKLNAQLLSDGNERKSLEAALKRALAACTELQRKFDRGNDVELVKKQETVEKLNAQLHSDRNERKNLESALQKALTDSAELQRQLRDHEKAAEERAQLVERQSAHGILAQTIAF